METLIRKHVLEKLPGLYTIKMVDNDYSLFNQDEVEVGRIEVREDDLEITGSASAMLSKEDKQYFYDTLASAALALVDIGLDAYDRRKKQKLIERYAEEDKWLFATIKQALPFQLTVWTRQFGKFDTPPVSARVMKNFFEEHIWEEKLDILFDKFGYRTELNDLDNILSDESRNSAGGIGPLFMELNAHERTTEDFKYDAKTARGLATGLMVMTLMEEELYDKDGFLDLLAYLVGLHERIQSIHELLGSIMTEISLYFALVNDMKLQYVDNLNEAALKLGVIYSNLKAISISVESQYGITPPLVKCLVEWKPEVTNDMVAEYNAQNAKRAKEIENAKGSNSALFHGLVGAGKAALAAMNPVNALIFTAGDVASAGVGVIQGQGSISDVVTGGMNLIQDAKNLRVVEFTVSQIKERPMKEKKIWVAAKIKALTPEKKKKLLALYKVYKAKKKAKAKK